VKLNLYITSKTKDETAKLEDLTAKTVKIINTVFLNVTTCSLVGRYRRFGGMCF
jgi:hypothetical protein